MAEAKPQTLANHTRWDPPFHFFILPIFTLGLLLSLVHFFAHITHGDMRDHIHAFLLILLALALLTLMFKVRLYSLKVQDRVIRLEERLRLAQLLPDTTRSRIGELNEGQLIALRFASDGEVAGLVQQTLDGKWDSKQIKGAVKVWRPDFFRV